ncbi:hypothetical protein ScPMuIL_003958 [Solemya velum]
MATDSASFFRQTSVPDKFEERNQCIKSFVERHKSLQNRIVLVSSGGTTVPLESRTVRFIDNFSVGTRGSSSAEYFLDKGYAVIFLYSKKSLIPYTRHFVKIPFLDLLDSCVKNDDVCVRDEYRGEIKTVLQKYRQVTDEGRLLMVDFSNLTEYLHLLRASSQHLNSIGPQAMLYLAAAVSDFYIPKSDMPQHKIQSSDGPLQLELQLVPKMLEPLTREWCPNAFTVSFKLETDMEILLSKAKRALNKYNHQVVIANLLETRKTEVMVVTRDSDQWLRLSGEELASGTEIETKIVEELQKKHDEFRT